MSDPTLGGSGPFVRLVAIIVHEAYSQVTEEMRLTFFSRSLKNDQSASAEEINTIIAAEKMRGWAQGLYVGSQAS